MILVNVVHVQAFPLAHFGGHGADAHAVADGDRRVTHKVQVRQRVHVKGIGLGFVDIIREHPLPFHMVQLLLEHAGDQRFRQLAVLHGKQVFLQKSINVIARRRVLVDDITHQVFAHLCVCQNIGQQLLHVIHVDTAPGEHPRKGVVLLLHAPEPRDILEEDLLEHVGHNALKLLAWPVQKDGVKLSDLRLYIQ